VTAFDAVLEPMPWGDATYTVIRVPPQLEKAAQRAGTRRVAGTIGGIDVNLAITRAPVLPAPFLYAGRPLQRALGARPGDVVACVLAPVDADVVLLPDDVAAALDAAGKSDAWEALSPSVRRTRLAAVDTAVRSDTRATRIATLVTRV
jgi:hypothetical protein